MNILVSFVSSSTGNIEKSFIADSVKYFHVNKRLSVAQAFVNKGISWEGSESFGSYLRIEPQSA